MGRNDVRTFVYSLGDGEFQLDASDRATADRLASRMAPGARFLRDEDPWDGSIPLDLSDGSTHLFNADKVDDLLNEACLRVYGFRHDDAPPHAFQKSDPRYQRLMDLWEELLRPHSLGVES